MHHRWVAQIESLDLPRVDGRPGWVHRWIVDEGCERAEAVAAMIDVAAIKSYGPGGKPAALPEAKWRNPAKKQRPSTQDLANELRRELWAQAI